MNLTIITGNKNKFEEAKKIFQYLSCVDIDVDEIQSMDSKEVVTKKLGSILKQFKKPFFCEDVSLEINALNKFPGPFIKFFLNSTGNKKIAKIVNSFEDRSAKLICLVGYFDGKKEHYFKGEIKGEIVTPRGVSGFGIDPIFKPINSEKTLSELTMEEKNKISHRYKAYAKLKEHLENEKRL